MRQTIVWHLALWLLFVSVYAALWSIPGRTFGENFLYESALVPFKVILVYSMVLWLLPGYFFTKHYVKFTLLVCLLVVTSSVLHQIYTVYIVGPVFDVIRNESLWDVSRITKRATYLTTPMLLATTLVVLQYYYRQNESVRNLTNEKLKAEVKLLTAQLNPHFFFNTMNNLYSLALKKSDETPHLILKLADLMRYPIDNTGRDEVDLQEELTFVKNYVAIEQERFGDKAQIEWNIDISSGSSPVPPLTLITFVENAFKHGVANSREPLMVHIDLTETADAFLYSVSNPIPLVVPLRNGKSLVGLANLRKRMEMIYGDRFKMTITSTDTFRAAMTIPKSR